MSFASLGAFLSGGTSLYLPLPTTSATFGAFSSLIVPSDWAYTHANGAGRNREPVTKPAFRTARLSMGIPPYFSFSMWAHIAPGVVNQSFFDAFLRCCSARRRCLRRY